MNEQYYNLTAEIFRNICCICFSSENVRAMSAREESWYRNIVYSVSTQFIQDEVYVCLTCSYYIRKCDRFSYHCQKANTILQQVIEEEKKSTILQPQPILNLSQTAIETHYCGSQNYVEVELNKNELKTEGEESVVDETNFEENGAVCDEIDEDDVPLMLLSTKDELPGDEVKRSEVIPQEVDLKIDLKVEQFEPAKENRKKKFVKEGFSSRMVQETEEYTVIKLTKEQVLEEMRSREASDKYQRSPYKCSLCVKGFNFEDVLATHMTKHDKNSGSFKCEMCSTYCPSAVSLRGHIKSHTTRYSCKVCGCVRLSRQHLLEHHAIAHRAAPTDTYSCQHCHFTSNKRTVMQRHVRGHRGGARFACDRCDRAFNTTASLRVHLLTHDKSKTLSCGECGARFIYASLLERHKRSVHVNKDYYCVECDVRFKSPENLRLHFKKAKRHRDSTAFTHQCPQCPQRFVSSPSLSVHLASQHGQPKQFPCTVCGRLYASRESLKGHLRRVHGDKKLEKPVCHLCKKIFSRKSILTVHLRSHSGERPFVCL